MSADAAYLGLTVVFFALSYGFTRLVERLR